MKALNLDNPLVQRKLNSLTQYPSIPTYHKINNVGKGHLTEVLNVKFTDTVSITEKVDGTNARIVLFPMGMWLIGGRTEWLTASGDLVYNPKNDIVETLRDTADRLAGIVDPDRIVVIYTEAYGSGTGANWKNYTNDKTVRGHRVFDAFSLHFDAYDEIMNKPIADIASWRDNGHQPFVDTGALSNLCDRLGLDIVPTLTEADASTLPTGIIDTEAWLQKLLPGTHVALDDTAKGNPEGVIVRSGDRASIVKIRFEDYARTARVTKQAELNAASAARRSHKTSTP